MTHSKILHRPTAKGGLERSGSAGGNVRAAVKRSELEKEIRGPEALVVDRARLRPGVLRQLVREQGVEVGK